MRLESQLAFRHLKSGGGKSLLTVGAVLAMVLASLLPARRAAKINPVDVIRAG